MLKSKQKKSERTRAAIFRAARDAFQAKSYEQVGLREIASEAKVTAAMVNRYFGNKKNLFREVLLDDAPYVELDDGPRSELGARLASLMVTGSATKRDGKKLELGIEQTMIFARSIGCPEASEILREDLEKSTAPLIEALGGEAAEEKVAAIFSCFLGFLLLHRVLQSQEESVRESSLEKHIAAGIQAIIDYDDKD